MWYFAKQMWYLTISNKTRDVSGTNNFIYNKSEC